MSDDLIKRSDAMQVAFLYPFFSDALIEEIKAIPSADRLQGEWVDRSGGIEGAWNYCSVCGEQAIDLYDYCPNCGAKMKGADDD